MSADYAEVVVNRPIIQRHTTTTEDIVYQEWSEQTDTRLKTFHYHIPAELKLLVQPGQMVAVPFRNQELQAVVVALSDSSPVTPTRPISAVLDPQPAVTAAQVELARFLADGYLAPLATCLRYFLPPGADRRPMTVLELLPPVPAVPPADLSPLETALFLYLKKQTKPVLFEEVEERVANGLIAKNLARKNAALSRPRIGPKIEQTVELLVTPDQFDDVLAQLGRPSKQAEILRYLAVSDDPLPALETVLAAAHTSAATVQALAERGWIEIIPAQTLVMALPHAESEKTANLPAEARQLRQILMAQAEPVPLEQMKLLAGLAPANAPSALKCLIEAGLATQIEEPAKVALRLPLINVPAAVMALRQTERYAAVLDVLAAEDGPVWTGWVYAQTDATSQVLLKLAQAGAIALDENRRWRDPLAGKTFTLDQPPPLTPEQTAILNTILPTLTSPGKPFLLHGVTGSGKTEIYLQAIAQILQQNRQVIFLVPEVMLATQIVQRVQARFPGKVAVWHSALSPGERFDTWERVRAGSLPIVVGPRSALFAPLQHVGLIIVDEEHEPAYKQDRIPTFHAREAAIEYARLTNSAIIMGSATPDVVSYRKAQRGEYHLLCLPDRILAHKNHLAVQTALLKRQKLNPHIQLPANSADPLVALPLPPVEIVDLREELKAGNRSIFSRLLAQGIEQTLSAGEQVILFLNRRGTATFVICRDCGHVMACPRCDTTLTYHSPNTLLACHYCGYQTREPDFCPECGSKRIKYFGLGTERVEETLRQMFPQARPIRMDQDTTRQAGSHYTLLQQFMEGRANVMIGTQMVAKGLDLPLVTLVGVISADTALYLPEFRAAERTFQVLMQVAGRAGRSPLGGRVILQTYTPEQPAILAAAGHNYQAFYNKELRFRYEQGYPPFKRLARLTHSSAGLERSRGLAQNLADRLRLWVDQQGFPAAEIIGPAPTFVPRIGSRFSWQILVRAPDPVKILRQTPLPLDWKVDIDPVNLL